MSVQMGHGKYAGAAGEVPWRGILGFFTERGGFMYVVSVTVFVKPEFVEAFIEATMDNATNTRREPGNVRFDVSQGEEDPTRFLFYEVYREKAGFLAHQQTEHYLRWKNAVADWMREPRVGVKHKAIYFGDGEVQEWI